MGLVAADAHNRILQKAEIMNAKQLWNENFSRTVFTYLQHVLWLERERLAQAIFDAKKEREVKERLRREDEERKIKEEWEERQKKEKAEQEERKKIEDEKKLRQDELLKQATANERKGKDDGSWHNPLAPAGYTTEAPDRPICEFFSKIGVCRFRDRCSRSHNISMDDSCTLLFPGMYSHFEFDQSMHDEYDTDLTLEFEDSDIYQHFELFYEDVLPEFKAVGRVVQFKVCCNYEPHLRGNVYVQYYSHKEALDAYSKFNGRWYAGKQLSCQFTCISRWKQAICGLFHQRKCPKGRHCNFMHVFRNPKNEFHDADLDIYRLMPSSVRRDSRVSRHDRAPNDSRHSSCSRRSYGYDSVRTRSVRSRSRSRSRRPARSRTPTRRHHRSPKRRSRSRSHRSSRSSSRRRRHERQSTDRPRPLTDQSPVGVSECDTAELQPGLRTASLSNGAGRRQHRWDEKDDGQLASVDASAVDETNHIECELEPTVTSSNDVSDDLNSAVVNVDDGTSSGEFSLNGAGLNGEAAEKRHKKKDSSHHKKSKSKKHKKKHKSDKNS